MLRLKKYINNNRWFIQNRRTVTEPAPSRSSSYKHTFQFVDERPDVGILLRVLYRRDASCMTLFVRRWHSIRTRSGALNALIRLSRRVDTRPLFLPSRRRTRTRTRRWHSSMLRLIDCWCWCWCPTSTSSFFSTEHLMDISIDMGTRYFSFPTFKFPTLRHLFECVETNNNRFTTSQGVLLRPCLVGFTPLNEPMNG